MARLLVGGTTYAYQIAPEEMVNKARRWGELAEAHGVSLPAVALAFCALPACVERLVIGIATVEELEQVLAHG
jgi:D-threo-aldose 1-dehydrogenase